jgi:hypothetical protein
MTDNPSTAPEQGEELQAANQPGSQSSSGMSSDINDSLVEAYEREKQQKGEPLDVAPESLGANFTAQSSEQTGDADRNSPINRNPEATTGPVTD